MKEISLHTGAQTEMVDVTDQVQAAVEEIGAVEGVCTVFVPHTTAAVTINENADPSVRRDIVAELNKIVPFDGDYAHGEGNSAAHIKATLVGPSIQMIVAGGRLMLGTWQGIYFCEFDGPRTRRVWVDVR